MGYKIKGFFYGIILVATFTSILAPMIFTTTGDGLSCNYFCAVGNFISYYPNPLALLFFAINWFLGTRIAKLSYLLAHAEEPKVADFKWQKNAYSWLWEHKLKTVEE